MQVKICGITQPDQGRSIAQLGATALGFICVEQSPRYVSPDRIKETVAGLPAEVDRIGVFANTTVAAIHQIVMATGLNGVQLHGNESPQFCQALRQTLPTLKLIKAVRVRSVEQLATIDQYQDWIDLLLLDAYHPGALGGTGKTLDWNALQTFSPFCPWYLAGGITPENVQEAVSLVRPHGIDLSSGVETSPGDKDLGKVRRLFEQLRQMHSPVG